MQSKFRALHFLPICSLSHLVSTPLPADAYPVQYAAEKDAVYYHIFYKKEKCSLLYDNSCLFFQYHISQVRSRVMNYDLLTAHAENNSHCPNCHHSQLQLSFAVSCDKWRATSLQFGSDVLLCCRPFGPLL